MEGDHDLDRHIFRNNPSNYNWEVSGSYKLHSFLQQPSLSPSPQLRPQDYPDPDPDPGPRKPWKPWLPC